MFDDFGIINSNTFMQPINYAICSTQVRCVQNVLKFIYSEKATNSWDISTIDMSYVVMVKCTMEISQNFVVFSENMNFISSDIYLDSRSLWKAWNSLIFKGRSRKKSISTCRFFQKILTYKICASAILIVQPAFLCSII